MFSFLLLLNWIFFFSLFLRRSVYMWLCQTCKWYLWMRAIDRSIKTLPEKKKSTNNQISISIETRWRLLLFQYFYDLRTKSNCYCIFTDYIDICFDTALPLYVVLMIEKNTEKKITAKNTGIIYLHSGAFQHRKSYELSQWSFYLFHCLHWSHTLSDDPSFYLSELAFLHHFHFVLASLEIQKSSPVNHRRHL